MAGQNASDEIYGWRDIFEGIGIETFHTISAYSSNTKALRPFYYWNTVWDVCRVCFFVFRSFFFASSSFIFLSRSTGQQ